MKHSPLRPRILVAKNYSEMSRLAGEYIEAEVRTKPDLIICASAGGTPTGVYERMAKRHADDRRLFRKLRVLQIDEWGGLSPKNPATCRMDLVTKLLGPLAINGERFEGFRSDAKDPERDCQRIARWLAQNGPIDICLLGLGLNGHLAMNEPGDEFVPHTHVSTLARSSLNHGMLRSLKRKPRYGLTLGMGDILRSRKLLLVVNGKAKRKVLAKLLEGKVSTHFPASFLWLHSDATIICDRESANHR